MTMASWQQLSEISTMMASWIWPSPMAGLARTAEATAGSCMATAMAHSQLDLTLPRRGDHQFQLWLRTFMVPAL